MYGKIVTVIAIFCFVGLIALFIKSGYLSKLLFKLGLKDCRQGMNWTAFSWESCLRKLDCDAEVVFFGDSIIRGGDFHKEFSQLKIVNLGSSGDTLSGMKSRVSMVQAVSPDKVFILGGINGLTDLNIALCVKKYDALLNALQESVPNAQIFVHSLLPISFSKEKHICKNTTINAFNKEIEKLARKRNLTFIDIHSLYIKNGEMNPELTLDGLHIKSEAYKLWFDSIRYCLTAKKV